MMYERERAYDAGRFRTRHEPLSGFGAVHKDRPRNEGLVYLESTRSQVTRLDIDVELSIAKLLTSGQRRTGFGGDRDDNFRFSNGARLDLTFGLLVAVLDGRLRLGEFFVGGDRKGGLVEA